MRDLRFDGLRRLRQWTGVVAMGMAFPFFGDCRGGGGVAVEQPRLHVILHDAPGDFVAVPIVVDSVRVHRVGPDDAGWQTAAEGPQSLDLMQLQGGASAVLGDASIPAGSYNQIRLVLQEASVEVETGPDGATQVHELAVPSGEQSGLKLHFPFEVQQDQEYELVLDFDAAASIKQNGNAGYKLTPVLRVDHFGPVAQE